MNDFIVTRHQLIADVDLNLKKMQKRGMSCTVTFRCVSC